MDDNYNKDDNYDESEYNDNLIGQIAKKKASELKMKALMKVLAILGPIGILIIIILIPLLLVIAILAGGDIANDLIGYNGSYLSMSSNSYWWPIGSSEVTIENGKLFARGTPSLTIDNISSNFSISRTINSVTRAHYGIDITGSGQVNVHNVIATKDGIVYKVNTNCNDNGYYGNSCGGQLGNYVYIKHSDGSFSKYGHMAAGSITVTVGEAVKQGQAIGKVGNSGSSTGAHLHFQLEIGGLGSSYAVDPLTYLSASNYRPSGQGDSSYIVKMLHSWEGTGPTDGDYYIVYDDGYGTLTVGRGVTLIYQRDKFSDRGIDINALSEGSKILKSIVDDIELEILNNMRNSILSLLSSNNISLGEQQVDALLMRMYNTGNISDFPTNYKKYGNTQELYDNYMKYPVKSSGVYSSGLARRRNAEWNLFHNGIYQLN